MALVVVDDGARTALSSSGRLGWVRSRAWIWDFSSKEKTEGIVGWFMYRPTTSTSFSSSPDRWRP